MSTPNLFINACGAVYLVSSWSFLSLWTFHVPITISFTSLLLVGFTTRGWTPSLIGFGGSELLPQLISRFTGLLGASSYPYRPFCIINAMYGIIIVVLTNISISSGRIVSSIILFIWWYSLLSVLVSLQPTGGRWYTNNWKY